MRCGSHEQNPQITGQTIEWVRLDTFVEMGVICKCFHNRMKTQLVTHTLYWTPF